MANENGINKSGYGGHALLKVDAEEVRTAANTTAAY